MVWLLVLELLAYLLVPLFLLVGVLVTVYSMTEIVSDGEVEALFVRGEFKTLLSPGINLVPPFISSTYPVDPHQLTIDRNDGPTSLPEEGHDHARELAGVSEGGEDEREYGVEYD